ncbi:PD-(D/E)XK nuclease-like domain-containing protein [Homoserinibacter sp. GY 40078]|uniref:PD-(D/E)XK nuclease-like domain-containing protein n=1 Tax=Homoserinibacter sp. GY 40078 TaxID=2603275 RepID=UPI0011C714F4|nr:PD-(D/E)XK nuclease-like domain-containing protein [Homoserinibacter sp. GY 40078]TXK17379.1 hypothetical protein FVQ89_11130 [Homoserinibacter sp. GY 40078]
MTAARVRANYPEGKYHEHPALSATGAKRILKSPRTFDYWRTHPQPPKDEFDLGHAVHAKVLGVGAQIAVYPRDVLATNGAASTSAAKEWAAQQRAAGRVPVKRDVADKVNAMAEAVLGSTTARALLEQDGTPEATIFNTDPETGIDLRARFDFLPKRTGRRRIAVDLKTTTDASPAGFARAVARFRYDVQQPHYLHTYDPSGAPDLEFAFVAVESEPPHHVLVAALDSDFVSIGVTDAAHARRLFAECARSNTWPGYPDEVVLLKPPMFHVYDFQDAHNDDH